MTTLSVKAVNDILAEFVFNEEDTKVLLYPARYEPKSCGYTGGKSHSSIFHSKETNVRIIRAKAVVRQKRVSSVAISVKLHNPAKLQYFMSTKEFKNLFKIGNSVEIVPSLLRRKYHADKVPVRELIHGRFFFGGKIESLNFTKLFTFRKVLEHYTQNPVLV